MTRYGKTPDPPEFGIEAPTGGGLIVAGEPPATADLTASGIIDREVNINFAAASAGQSLLITYTLLDNYGVAGNITLAGAVLAGDGALP